MMKKNKPPSPNSGAPQKDERASLFQAAPVGVCLLDRDFRFVHINDRLAEINEKPVDAHIGRTIHEVFPEELADKLEPVLHRVLDWEEPAAEVELEGPAPANSDKERRHWLFNFKPCRTGAGEILGVCIVVLDVTDKIKKTRIMKECLEFDKMLSTLSAHFINLPANRMDHEIENALRIVVKCLLLDRGGVGLFSEDGTEIRSTHSYAVKGVEPYPKQRLNEELPYLVSVIRRGEIYRAANIDETPKEAVKERAYAERTGIKANATLPLHMGGKLIGAIAFDSFHIEREWNDQLVQRLRLVAEIFSNALARQKAEREIEGLKDQLTSENLYLREEISTENHYEEIVADSKEMKAVLAQAEQVAGTDSSVLLAGETGTGKEVIARLIHSLSGRRDRVMVKVNCAALPSTLVESELFGREKGAYTGALSRQVGRFDVANGSTIFLDEVGELSLELQVKLLRVLQEGAFERLGSPKTITVDVRLIAATNRDLAGEVEAGRFRKDLFYRLNVFPITLPPLRERRKDIPPLVRKFVHEFEGKMGKTIENIPRKTMELLKSHAWPGNVRELRNAIERAMILSKGPALRVELPQMPGTAETPEITLLELERRHIIDALEKTGWRVSGRGGAAEILGLKPTTLESKMQKLGIKRP